MSGTQVTLQGTLFGNNEPGFTFEPWDISTLYQDRAGTTPVTAAGQSVGLRLDKSGRGNHQVAVSDAKRGVYGWMPKTGKRNLLTYTEQFDNAVWTKTNTTVTADATAAPDGTNTADKLSETATTASHYAYETFTSTGVRIVYSVYAKAAERRRIAVWEGTTSANGAVFDLISGTVVNNLAAGVGSIQSVGDGWYRCSVTSTETAGTRWLVCSVLLDDATGVGGTVGVAGSGIYVWGAQLEVGSTATAYQRVTSQYDITEAGVPTCYYVQADGVDDAYVTPTITPNTDKVQVFAGVRKLSDAAIGAVMESSANSNSNAGAIWLLSPGSPGVNQYSFRSKGTTAADANASGFSAPITNILTGLGDIAADSAILRVNGAQVAQSAADQGTGNFLAYPAYIYARGGTSLPFNGLDFGHAVRFGPNLDAATIARVESLIARNTPEVDFMFGGVWTDQYNWDDETNWNDGA